MMYTHSSLSPEGRQVMISCYCARLAGETSTTARSEVLTAIFEKFQVFWGVLLFSWVNNSHSFEAPYCLQNIQKYLPYRALQVVIPDRSSSTRLMQWNITRPSYFIQQALFVLLLHATPRRHSKEESEWRLNIFWSSVLLSVFNNIQLI